MNIQKFTQKSVEAVNDLRKAGLRIWQSGDRAGTSAVWSADAGGQPDPETDREDGDQTRAFYRTVWNRH